jgi:hypothetical protein
MRRTTTKFIQLFETYDQVCINRGKKIPKKFASKIENTIISARMEESYNKRLSSLSARMIRIYRLKTRKLKTK